jgi:hypothetical protein
MQPGIEVWVWEFPRRMSPIAVHFRSTSTLKKGLPDVQSEHSSVVINLADLRFALTCQSWSANGAEGKQQVTRSISVQLDLMIKLSAPEEALPECGGFWNLLSAAKTNTLVKIQFGLTLQSHPDGSTWKKLARALVPLKWETSPAQAVAERIMDARVRAKTTAINLISFLFC